MRDSNIPEGYKTSPLGVIPSDWSIKELGEVSIIKGDYGINAASVEYSNHLPTYLRITDIDEDGEFLGQDKKSVDDLNAEKYILEDEDIVFARTGATVGKTYLHNKAKDGELVFAGFLIRFRTDKNTLLPFYLKSFTATKLYWDWVKRVSMRSGQPGINSTEYCALKIPIPPIQEQESIEVVFRLIEESIQKINQLISKKELQKKALMQQLLSGKKRLKGFDGEWKKVGAGEIFKSVSKKGFDDEELLSATQDNGIIPRSMLPARVTMPTGDRLSFKLVEKGDFVISLRSFQGGLEYSYYRGIVSPAYTVLKPKRKINDEFYKQYYKSYDFIGHLATAVVGIRDGKQISYDDYCMVKIPYPSFEEQSAIANVLQAADTEIAVLKAKGEKLKQQKKGMMQLLLTGKKRLKLTGEN